MVVPTTQQKLSFDGEVRIIVGCFLTVVDVRLALQRMILAVSIEAFSTTEVQYVQYILFEGR